MEFHINFFTAFHNEEEFGGINEVVHGSVHAANLEAVR